MDETTRYWDQIGLERNARWKAQQAATAPAGCTHCWHDITLTHGRTTSAITSPRMQCCFCRVQAPWNLATALGHGPYLPA